MYKFNINKIVVNTSEGTKDIVPKMQYLLNNLLHF